MDILIGAKIIREYPLDITLDIGGERVSITKRAFKKGVQDTLDEASAYDRNYNTAMYAGKGE